MHHRAPRARRTVLPVAVPVGLVMSLALTWNSTHAAFSASTGNVGNSWQTGSVVLTHSDSAAALFSTSTDGALKPGSARSRCIRLDYTGSLPADIRMYGGTPPADGGTPAAGATALDPYLVMSVERGADVTSTTSVDADCTGFTPKGAPFTPTDTPAFPYNSEQADGPSADVSKTLAHLKATHRDFASGLVVSEDTAPNTYMTLRITYVLEDDNLAQDKQSSATFTWEARNT